MNIRVTGFDNVIDLVGVELGVARQANPQKGLEQGTRDIPGSPYIPKIKLHLLTCTRLFTVQSIDVLHLLLLQHILINL